MAEALPESGRRGKIEVKSRLSERRGWADHQNRSVLRGTVLPGDRPVLSRWSQPFAYTMTGSVSQSENELSSHDSMMRSPGAEAGGPVEGVNHRFKRFWIFSMFHG